MGVSGSFGLTQVAEASLYAYSSHAERDGRFRRVKVELASRIAADPSYRAGYYGGKDFSKYTRTDKERQLEDALTLEDSITDIPMAIEVNYFQLNRAEYFVPVSVRMPASELARARPNGAINAEIDIIGEIR